jgi:hypothetical protein
VVANARVLCLCRAWRPTSGETLLGRVRRVVSWESAQTASKRGRQPACRDSSRRRGRPSGYFVRGLPRADLVEVLHPHGRHVDAIRFHRRPRVGRRPCRLRLFARVEGLLDHDEVRIVLCAPRTEAAYARRDLYRVVISSPPGVVIGNPAVAEHGRHAFPQCSVASDANGATTGRSKGRESWPRDRRTRGAAYYRFEARALADLIGRDRSMSRQAQSLQPHSSRPDFCVWLSSDITTIIVEPGVH